MDKQSKEECCMKRNMIALTVFWGLSFAVAAQAQETKGSTTESASAAPVVQEQAASAVEVGNKICPVSLEKVGQMGEEIVKIEYKGKIYNLCCSMCKKDFNKNPDKYTKIADDEVAASAQEVK